MTIAPLSRGEQRQAPASLSAHPPTLDRRILEDAVKHSMTSVLTLLGDVVASDDEAMIAIGASADHFVEPLGKHEVQLLACALYMEKQDQPLVYQDVLRLTDRFSGRAMNITMIYRTVERLIERGMLVQGEAVDGSGDRSRTYRIHGQGREAFRLAVINSQLLAGVTSPVAA